MSSLLVILIGTVLVNTFLLMQNDEALGGTRHRGSIANAIRIGGATAIVLILAAIIANLLWRSNRMLPRDSLLFVFAVAVVAVAAVLDRWSHRRYVRLERAITTSPLLIVSNSLALGTGSISVLSETAAATIFTVIALAASFVVAMPLFVALVSRISLRDVPATFRVAPITLVSAGLFSLALMGFTGLLRG